MYAYLQGGSGEKLQVACLLLYDKYVIYLKKFHILLLNTYAVVI